MLQAHSTLWQPHSFLWHYLWIAPHLIQLGLATFLVRRRLHRHFPVFFTALILEAVLEFILLVLDELPSVSDPTYWRAYFVVSTIEGLLRAAVIGELFTRLIGPWPVLAKVGSRLISGTGATLVFIATAAAAVAPIDNPDNPIISKGHILQQSVYVIVTGLILFVFLFAAHFRIAWDSRTYGVAVGLAILSCEHLATWAISANGLLFYHRELLDFFNMGTYHFCVLLWFYYMVVPEKVRAPRPADAVHHQTLEVWNRELERFLHQ